MGWLILFALIAAAFAGLWLLGLRGGLLTASAAALALGGAGYALQGEPGQTGAPASAPALPEAVPLAEARHIFFDRFTRGESWLVMAEALERRGRTGDSAALLQNAVRRSPGDIQLWIGLGNALVAHSRGLTPPAELAYRRAAALNPAHPAPAFFYGLALARSGEPAGAITVWKGLLENAPADAPWRPLVEDGIAALEPQAATGK
jgi:cytochrome c-type biogenesis protein CcmH